MKKESSHISLAMNRCDGHHVKIKKEGALLSSLEKE